jgi:hypothetical protein
MMKFKVGDLVKWDGHDARIAVIMQHPSRYIIEYTVGHSDVSGSITHAFGRTKIVKEDALKYECKICGCEVNEEDFIAFAHGDIWLCNDCRESIIPFSVEGG